MMPRYRSEPSIEDSRHRNRSHSSIKQEESIVKLPLIKKRTKTESLKLTDEQIE